MNKALIHALFNTLWLKIKGTEMKFIWKIIVSVGTIGGFIAFIVWLYSFWDDTDLKEMYDTAAAEIIERESTFPGKHRDTELLINYAIHGFANEKYYKLSEFSKHIETYNSVVDNIDQLFEPLDYCLKKGKCAPGDIKDKVCSLLTKVLVDLKFTASVYERSKQYQSSLITRKVLIKPVYMNNIVRKTCDDSYVEKWVQFTNEKAARSLCSAHGQVTHTHETVYLKALPEIVKAEISQPLVKNHCGKDPSNHPRFTPLY